MSKFIDSEAGTEAEVSAKYIIGCDGSHSKVRKLLGVKSIGDKSTIIKLIPRYA
jgi:2-polyprenyl-6-methoxyphenol hydroxylase-like FAD-dependent oxidoreductase